MDSLEDRETLISEEKIGSDTETTDRILDFESGAIDELNQPVPGMWLRQINSKYCCIYRVPHCIRQVNPEAYTPQSVIIGPLHHSLIRQALKSRGDITNTKSMGYLNMERLKKFYLTEFARRVEGGQTIDGLRRIIEEEEDMIRESYSESTAWIKSPQFIDMILHDSVFIIEFIFRSYENITGDYKEYYTCHPISVSGCNYYLKRKGKLFGEPLMKVPCLHLTVINDLLLLENQLPYFILERLSDGIISKLFPGITFRKLVIKVLLEESKISDNSEFKHFTDMSRFVYVETLPEHAALGEYKCLEYMYNADKLDSGGVEFEIAEKEFSLNVRFEKGCLKMSCLTVDDKVEMRFRNVMALEQCHYPNNARVCNYVHFLDYLINTHKDVEVLVEKGVIKNWIGEDDYLAGIVNKLNFGIIDHGSYYTDLADRVNTYYKNPINKSRALLKRVYFGNLWTGTATVAATFLLIMTLIQTVASIMQVMQ